MLVDSHCHLDFPDFEGELPEILERAGAAGVGCLLTICTHVSRFDAVLALAEAHDNIFCSVGIHPHEAAHEPEVSAEKLIELAGHPKVVGFGETGLDFHYENSPRADQERSFRAHIAAARESGLPVIVHSRAADDEIIEILADEQAKGAFSGVIHCFSSGPEMARAVLDFGLYISVAGIVTFKNAGALRETVKSVPLERLLVETDAPYLAPVPKRGKRNEPAFVAHTAAEMSAILGIGGDELAKATTDNFFRLFSKARIAD